MYGIKIGKVMGTCAKLFQGVNMWLKMSSGENDFQ